MVARTGEEEVVNGVSDGKRQGPRNDGPDRPLRTCWIYGGVTLNPLFWPARHDETLLMKALYTFHPDFTGARIWRGDPIVSG